MNQQTSTDSASQRKHYYAVDALRGLCAIFVLFFHYVHFYYPAGVYHLGGETFEQAVRDMPWHRVFSPLYHYGGAAVQVFWCISGFVFASVYAQTRTSAKDFFVRRFARLYPLHFLTLVVVCILQFIAILSVGRFIVYEYNDLYHFILNILFIPAWGFEKGYSFNSPIWSVSIELIIYLLFWIVSSKIFSKSYVKPVGIAVLMLVLMYLQVPIHMFWLCGFYFFLGVCMYRFYSTSTRAVLYGAVLSLASFVMAVVIYKFVDSELVMILPFLTFAAISAAVALDASRWAGLFRRIRFIGDSTYGTYLWHVPIQLVLILLLDAAGLREHVVRSPLFLLFFLAIVSLAGWLSYRFIEAPANRAIIRFEGLRREKYAAVEW